MTVERWTDDQLDQLATDVQGNAAAITNLRASSEHLLQTAQIHQASFNAVQRNFDAIQRNFDAIIVEIRDMKTEIRGLQLENRRMLQEMRGLPPDAPSE